MHAQAQAQAQAQGRAFYGYPGASSGAEGLQRYFEGFSISAPAPVHVQGADPSDYLAAQAMDYETQQLVHASKMHGLGPGMQGMVSRRMPHALVVPLCFFPLGPTYHSLCTYSL